MWPLSVVKGNVTYVSSIEGNVTFVSSIGKCDLCQ